MEIRFINDKPALLIFDRKFGSTLVVADIHLGIEHELFRNGIVIAPQSQKFYEELDGLITITKAKRLIILGDLKHKIPGISFREVREIPKLMSPLSEKVEVVLVRGNHDTHLDDLLPRAVKTYDAGGFSIGPYGFFHGHAWPARELLECDYLFTAHIHPTVEFVDDLGFRMVEKVWIKSSLVEMVVRDRYGLDMKPKCNRTSEPKKGLKIGSMETIIFPAFNPIINGFPLNSSKNNGKNYIGPLLISGALEVKGAEAFMLDGTDLGKVGKIK